MKYATLSASRLLILPFVLTGLVGCQEENTPTQSVEPPQTTSSPTTNDTKVLPIEAKVLTINDDQLVVRNSNGQDLTITPTPMTLVDAGLEPGDLAEIRYGQDQQPIAIRKIRAADSPENLSQRNEESSTVTGNLAGIQNQEGVYVLHASAGEEMKFSTDADTLIDESIQVGDEVEVRTSGGNQAIAIRKVRSEKE